MGTTRDKILELARLATTREELRRVNELRDAYLLEHPDDHEVFAIGEMLDMLEAAVAA